MMLCFHFQIPLLHCQCIGKQLTSYSNLISCNLVLIAPDFCRFFQIFYIKYHVIWNSFNIEIFLASNPQIQTKPILESLDTEAQTNFLLTYNSPINHSAVWGIVTSWISRCLMHRCRHSTQTFFFFNLLLGSILKTLQCFTGVDLSDMETQTEKTSATKIDLFRKKSSFQQYRTQIMSTGFETLGILFISSETQTTMDTFLLS